MNDIAENIDIDAIIERLLEGKLYRRVCELCEGEYIYLYVYTYN